MIAKEITFYSDVYKKVSETFTGRMVEVTYYSDEEHEYAYVVYVNNQEVFRWRDMNQDAPEDLIWTRELREIFLAGFKAGQISKIE